MNVNGNARNPSILQQCGFTWAQEVGGSNPLCPMTTSRLSTETSNLWPNFWDAALFTFREGHSCRALSVIFGRSVLLALSLLGLYLSFFVTFSLMETGTGDECILQFSHNGGRDAETS